MDDDRRVKKLLWISHPYMQDDMTWCVASARPRDLWSNIFQIFTPITWLAIISTIIMFTIAVKQLLRSERKIESYGWAFMLSITAIIGKSVAYEASRTSVRVMMFFLFVFGLIISTSFCTFLISTLTQPRFKHQIDNLPDAIRAGFKFASGNLAYAHYHHADPVTIFFLQNIGKLQNLFYLSCS